MYTFFHQITGCGKICTIPMSAVPGTAQPTKKERPGNGAFTFNKKGRISDVNVGGKDAWFMYGPVYLSREFSAKFLPVLEAYYQIPGTEQFYWEQPYVDMLKGEAKRRLEKEDKELLKQT